MAIFKRKNIFTSPAWGDECTGLGENFIRFTISNKKEIDLVLKILSDFQRLF